jgi:hypothetical protein
MMFGDNWLGKEVTFTLLGQRVTGTVIEAIHEICTYRWLIVEFRDGPKQVKVGGPYQAFRRIDR